MVSATDHKRWAPITDDGLMRNNLIKQMDLETPH